MKPKTDYYVRIQVLEASSSKLRATRSTTLAADSPDEAITLMCRRWCDCNDTPCEPTATEEYHRDLIKQVQKHLNALKWRNMPFDY